MSILRRDWSRSLSRAALKIDVPCFGDADTRTLACRICETRLVCASHTVQRRESVSLGILHDLRGRESEARREDRRSSVRRWMRTPERLRREMSCIRCGSRLRYLDASVFLTGHVIEFPCNPTKFVVSFFTEDISEFTCVSCTQVAIDETYNIMAPHVTVCGWGFFPQEEYRCEIIVSSGGGAVLDAGMLLPGPHNLIL